MNALSVEPKIISLANTLGVGTSDPVECIRKFCTDRVRHYARRKELPTDIAELQQIVCESLNLAVHEIWSDTDLDRVARSYLDQGEPVFAFLKDDLNSGTYGVLIRLNKRKGSQFYWVAIVDCRGDKASRRFFTIWHEIVHCITAADQYELPFHRTKISRDLVDPIERMTDLVAADLAFFDPLFRPILEEHTYGEGRLTFEIVRRVRERFCRGASFESTLNACVSRSSFLIILVKADMALKKSEEDAINSPQGQLFPTARPVARLRIISAIANDAARSNALYVHRNMRVPPSSIISLVFNHGELVSRAETENLSDWTSSDGGALADVEVVIEARKVGDQVWALISSA